MNVHEKYVLGIFKVLLERSIKILPQIFRQNGQPQDSLHTPHRHEPLCLDLTTFTHHTMHQMKTYFALKWVNFATALLTY